MKNLLLMVLLLTSHGAFSADHSQHSQHDMKKMNNSKSVGNFKAPQDLKERMDKILSLVIEASKIKTEKKNVAVYGNKIIDVVNDIFKACKLEAAADEAIHPSLGEILSGAEDFKNGDFEKGHKKIHEAYVTYQKLFSKK